MSAGYLQTQWPQKCFNAQNHWSLGWFQDRQLDLAVVPGTSPQLYNLATFVDYDKTSPDDVVIIRIDKVFYLHYNRAKDFNEGTQMNANSVTMVEFMTGFPGTALLAGLNAQTRPYELMNYKGSESSLVIDVCSLLSGSSNTPDTAIISIGLGGSLCNAYRGGQATVRPLNPTTLTAPPQAPVIFTSPPFSPSTTTMPAVSPVFIESQGVPTVSPSVNLSPMNNVDVSSQPSSIADVNVQWLNEPTPAPQQDLNIAVASGTAPPSSANASGTDPHDNSPALNFETAQVTSAGSSLSTSTMMTNIFCFGGLSYYATAYYLS
jgi:hypothetical protein